MQNLQCSITQNPELAEEFIFTEILPKLPVKSLVRFKCVSKSWQSIISSAHFAKAQLQAQLASPSSSSRCVLTKENYFSILDYGECDDIVHDDSCELYEFDDFDLNCDGLAFLIGSCNGLVCFGWSDERFYDTMYYVYNPCTGDYVEIEDNSESEGDNLIFGFGSVSSEDDYKVVVIGLSLLRSNSNVYIYSLRTKKWRTIQGFNLEELAFASDHKEGGGLLVNETLHWDMVETLGDGSCRDCIGGFDLVEEKFKTMPLPLTKLGDNRGDHSGFRLCVMDGCLCAWGRFASGRVEMWMLKEYGVLDSWTKLFRVNLREELGKLCEGFFGFTEAGKVLIRTDCDELLLGDLSYDPVSYVRLANIDEAVNFVGSLISPSGISADL